MLPLCLAIHCSNFASLDHHCINRSVGLYNMPTNDSKDLPSSCSKGLTARTFARTNTYFCFTFLALIPSLFHITKQAATVNWECGAGHNINFNNIFVLLSIHTKILSADLPTHPVLSGVTRFLNKSPDHPIYNHFHPIFIYQWSFPAGF